MSRLALVLLLAPVVLALVPADVAAQSPATASVGMSLPTLPRPVPPGTEQRFNITVRYQWNNGLSPQPTTIRMEVVDQPSWLSSSFDPAAIEVNTVQGGPNTLVGGPQGTVVLPINLTITLAADAPAFDEGVATYRIVAEENPPLPAAEALAEFRVTAGFDGTLDVTLPEGDRVSAAGGFVTRVPVRLENRGNGPLLVDIVVARFPAEAQLSAPQSISLGTTPEDRVVTAYVEVRVPWKVSEEGLVELEIIPTHASRGTPAPVQETGFELKGNSAIPIPDSSLAPLLALLGAVVLLRPRRDA